MTGKIIKILKFYKTVNIYFIFSKPFILRIKKQFTKEDFFMDSNNGFLERVEYVPFTNPQTSQ